jgi:hypothetical protein
VPDLGRFDRFGLGCGSRSSQTTSLPDLLISVGATFLLAFDSFISDNGQRESRMKQERVFILSFSVSLGLFDDLLTEDFRCGVCCKY